jgi:hypothetical protein
MRRLVRAVLVTATLAVAPAAQAQILEYQYRGCNAMGTCGTATLFVESITRAATRVNVGLTWAPEAPGALSGSSLTSMTVTGLVGGAWERFGSCEYPIGLFLNCGVSYFPVSAPPRAPLGFQPDRIGIGIGYGRTEFGDPVSTMPLVLSAVPEPSTVALLGSGLLALGGMALRRRRRTPSRLQDNQPV